MLFPGEAEAVEAIKRLGEQYGYGNMIHRLKNAWSEYLQGKGMGKETADMAAGHVCVWCSTDSRTGKKVEESA